MIFGCRKGFFVYVLVIVVETSSLIQSGVLCNVLWRDGLSTKMVFWASLPILVDFLNLNCMNSSWSSRLGKVLKMGCVAATWKAESDTSVWQPRVEMKERTGEREEMATGKKRIQGKWDGQVAVCASLCEQWACLYSGFICVMLCDSIVRSRSTELVFPPSHQPPCCR